jgi:class 3 adenylate cyclase
VDAPSGGLATFPPRLISSYQNVCASAVAKFGGSVAKYLGDGVLAYFGYPEAHEDDSERAVRARLQLIDAISAIDPRSGFKPEIRVGVATGLVVVGELIGEGSAQERVAVGETLNLAARIQAAAPVNSLVISESTRRLAGAAFHYDDLGRHELKGAPQAAAPPEPKARDDAERRQLTVMFTDLVGSTALSARLDPEDFVTGAAPPPRSRMERKIFRRCPSEMPS